jgi:hypothetical protein
MITTLKWLPRSAVLLMVAVLVAVAFAVELANPSAASARYGLADNGVIHGYGIQGTGAVHAGHSGTAAPDDNGVIHSD